MPQVSIFKNVGAVTNPIQIELLEYLEKTRDGEWEDIVNHCRNIKDEEDKKAFKKTMPTTTLSGVFDYRSDEKLKVHSGFISMDLDDLEDLNKTKRQLIDDKYCFSVFMSTGGFGLRALFRIEPEKHRQAFKGISAYLFDKYSIICDHNGINVSKPFIVSFDPGIYINYDNVPLIKKYVSEKAEKKMPDYVHTTSDFDMILKQITGRGINICDSYHDTLKVGFSLSEHFGEEGRAYFHEVCRMSDKYSSGWCDKQFNHCLKARGTSKVRISTFYYFAKSAGVNIVSEQTKKIVRATKNGKRTGLSVEQIIENLKKFSAIEGADDVVNQVFEGNIEDTDEQEESILHLLEMFISNNYNIKMNEVTGFLEENGNQLTPADLNSMFVSAKKMIVKLDYQLMLRLLKSDFIETYNPFFKFFASDGMPVELPATPEKDQNRRFSSPLIDKLASTIENEDPKFTAYFLRKWIVSIVSAAHKVHSPLLFCLLGSQNTGKTEFFRRLLPKELKPYYSESKLDKGKDDELLMTENLIIMDDELGGKSKQETVKLNNVTSTEWYSLRRPYGDHNEKILRLAVLCGTSNYHAVLNDPTGNRRVIPVEVNNVNKELYNSIDKVQLFMEAFGLYKAGFDWRITGEDIAYLNKDRIKYEGTIKEREIIERYYKPGEDFRMSTTDIIIEIEIITKQRMSLVVTGRELENLGFDRKTTRIGNSTPKLWGIEKIGREMNHGRFDEEGGMPF